MTTVNLTNNTETFTLNGAIYTHHTETGRFSKTENGKTKRIGVTEYQVAEAEADRLDAEQELEDALREAEQNLNRAVMSGDKEEISRANSEWVKARAEWDNRHLDAAAENDKISLEQFVELVQEAEESATTEKIEEIQREMAPKAKKERKPRKSKDIAFEYRYNTIDDPEGEMVTLTAKQVDFIHHLPDSNFWERGLDSSLWTDVLCDEIGGQFAGKPMTVGAMISTLCEKGLAERGKMKVNGKKCTYFELSPKGKAIAEALGLH